MGFGVWGNTCGRRVMSVFSMTSHAKCIVGSAWYTCPGNSIPEPLGDGSVLECPNPNPKPLNLKLKKILKLARWGTLLFLPREPNTP